MARYTQEMLAWLVADAKCWHDHHLYCRKSSCDHPHLIVGGGNHTIYYGRGGCAATPQLWEEMVVRPSPLL